MTGLAITRNLTKHRSSAGGNGVIVNNWIPSTQLTHFNAAVAAVRAGTAGARAIITTIGDSTTGGVGANPGQAYPNALAAALGTIWGINGNVANFFGDQVEFTALTFSGTADWNFGLSAGGSGMLNLIAVADTITWTPTDGVLTGTFDRLDLNYWDQGVCVVSVTIDGNTYPLTIGATGLVKFQTITLSSPVTNPSSIVFTLTSGAASYIVGCNLWNHSTPSLQVFNFGVGGSEAVSFNVTDLTTPNLLSGALAFGSHVVFAMYGINDINFGTESITDYTTYMQTGTTTLQGAGIDVVLMGPVPFQPGTSPAPLFTQTQLVAALASVGASVNVATIDLRATYGNDDSDFVTSTFEGSAPHPSALGYSDIALRIASLITNTPQTYTNVGLPAPTTSAGWILD